MKKDLSNIKKSKFLLNRNECIGIPTETVYGLAANAYSDLATSKIFKLKKRPKNNPLIVHYYSLENLKKDCKINQNFIKLYKKFCPGPITFILKLKSKNKISKNVTNKKKTLAVRFPKHSLTRKLLKELDFPLAAPSANISTKVSAVSKKDVEEEFGNKIKFILDGGSSKIGLESTIVNLDPKPAILRLGAIEVSKINKVLKNKVNYKSKNNKNSVPGQGKLHYSPGIQIRRNVKNPKKHEAFLLIKKRKISDKNFFYLTKNNNLNEAGKNLYKTLRMIKKLKYNSISVEKIPNKGIGQTINDRLIRASKR
ncbi:L-threonylcarbamoyladenylate synthase [Candidatus Pelagibacter communis]|uniref:L-threonylcarbamoyladenylate synthase n=1 Tax=Pelagibacter ubique TaxID=198252 RepID=UPI00094D1326|nr:L-threonylcarbamoyladenylate synthase [Candidatus Pelagibacter ubique]